MGLQAVKAQAAAARSYALQPGSLGQRHLRHPELPGVFRSRVRASVGPGALAVEDGRTHRAIRETVGKVRRLAVDTAGAGKAGDIVSTEFSGSNGPRTAGWPFPVVDDALGDSTSLNRNHRWTGAPGRQRAGLEIGPGHPPRRSR